MTDEWSYYIPSHYLLRVVCETMYPLQLLFPPFIIAGPRSCREDPLHFLARWCKRRQAQGPNFQKFLERSLEDFFSKESMRIFETYLET